ncbi:MAG TPA: hypothetical protein VHR66_18605 [Gemmataceae bacterium]|jgi:hypothetical protein|nr:hypothetical protein [Gemmataceae bacterium]
MSAFLFVPLLAATWILGAFVAAQAAHFFLTVVESSATATADGPSWQGSSFKKWMRDGIDWPDDAFADHIGKAVYLGFLIAIWAGPSIVVARLVAGHTAAATVIAGAAFWLLFPIGLLSSMSAETRWTPFRPRLLVAFAQRPIKTFGFYLFSAPALAVVILTFDLVMIHTSKATVAWAAALAPIAAISFFFYARLLGRLGMIVSFVFDPEEEVEPARPRRRRKPKRPLNAYDPRTRMFGPTEEVPDDAPIDAQPPEMRGLLTPNGGEVTGYAVDYAGTAPVIEDPKPARIIHKFDDEDDEPIIVAPPPEISADRHQIAERIANPPEREMALFTKDRLIEPTSPYGSDTVMFLFDVKTMGPWLTLTLGLILLALFQRALDVLRPDLS